jgi:broad specificity phosphatase PhoE
MDIIRVYIVRHGETEENKQKIIQGHLDTPLNSEGERQADLVAHALKDVPFDVCYSSDLRRAVDTAKRILVNHSRAELQIEEAVRERVRPHRRRLRRYIIDLFSMPTDEGGNSIWAFFRVMYGERARHSSLRRTEKRGRR